MLSPEQLVASSIPRQILDHAGTLHLSIHLGRKDVGAAVCDPEDGTVKWVFAETLPSDDGWADPVDFIRHRNWKEQTFRKISISFDSDACTLVPSGFYQAERADELLSVLFRFHPSNETRTTDISLFSAKLLFRVPEEIIQLTQLFQNASVYPTMHAFLSRHFEMASSGMNIALQLLNDYLLIRITEGKKLVFCNFFKVHHDEDVLYYLANACMNLNINMHQNQVVVDGIPEGSTLWLTLSKYCLPQAVGPLFNTQNEISLRKELNGIYQNFLCV